LRFLLLRVALHLLGSESPHFEHLFEDVVQKAGFDNESIFLFDLTELERFQRRIN